uniref:alpha/beta hydrolase fold domain-containing protein n=1 Tax=Staphylococcus epidermidis TaxID=1282 RepID=UPI0011AA1DF1
DSAGGQIPLPFPQILKKHQLTQPRHILLISPLLHPTFNNPQSTKYQKQHPILPIHPTKYLLHLSPPHTPLHHYNISPINPHLQPLPHITLTLPTKQTLYP